MLNLRRCLRILPCVVGLTVMSLTGCSSLLRNSIPVDRVPPELLAIPRENMQEISFTRLRQDAPETYLIGDGDVLGVFIETVTESSDFEVLLPRLIGGQPSGEDEEGSLPAFGTEFLVQEDGTISLPYIDPLDVGGLSLKQVRDAIRVEYQIKRNILKAGSDRIDVTLVKKRKYRVMVIREDMDPDRRRSGKTGESSNATVHYDLEEPPTGRVVELPAYENDVLGALSRTGGLPGLFAKNEVLIYRGLFNDATDHDAMISALHAQFPYLDEDQLIELDPSVTRIPIRFHSYNPPTFTEKDVILSEGDIVVVRARDRDVFYTGGAIPGGEHQLPRDYDLDVLGALAIAGGQIGQGAVLAQAGGQGGRGRSGTGLPPSLITVLREVPGGGQISICIDVDEAMADPSKRILIKPGDVVVMQFRWHEDLINFFLQSIQIQWSLNDI